MASSCALSSVPAPARAEMTSLIRASLSDWIALMMPISKWSFLLLAHFIRASVSAKISTRLSKRSVDTGLLASMSASHKSCGMPSLLALGSIFATRRARKQPIVSSSSRLSSLPSLACSLRRVSADEAFLAKMLWVSDATVSLDVYPKTLSTSFSVILLPQNATSWSSIDWASRMPPSAPLATAQAAAGSNVTFSLFAMKVS